ncbi:MAG: flagellar hook-length control protein FliK [Armatimonadia bacterium]
MPQQIAAAVTVPPAPQQTAMPMVMRLDAPALPLPVIRRLTGIAPQPVQTRLPKPVPAPPASASEQTQLVTAAIQPADEAALVPASPQPVVVQASAPAAPAVQAVTVPDKRMPGSPATPAMSTPRLAELADTVVRHIAVAVAAPPAKAALTAREPGEQAIKQLARAAERAPMASTVEKVSAITADVELSRREATEPGPTNSAASPAPQVLSQTLHDALPITPTATPQFQQTVQDLPEREVSAAERVTAQPQATETPDEVVHQVRLTLSPPDLGAVTLRIETRGQEVSAHLVVDQLVAGHVLRQAETEVRQLLHNQGLQMGSYEVDYQHSQQHQPHQRPLPLALPGKAIAVPSRPQGRQPRQESAIDVFA